MSTLIFDQPDLQLTYDPNPVRFDGKPPEPEPLLLASIGSLSHLLANAAIAYTLIVEIYWVAEIACVYGYFDRTRLSYGEFDG